MDSLTHAKYVKVKNNCGMEVMFCNFGAAIYSIKIDDNYVTFSPMHKAKFITSTSYYGKTVGPICGRIKDGKIVSKFGNIQLKNKPNENNNVLHSGEEGISFLEFNIEKIDEKFDSKTITFTRDYVDTVNDGLFDAEIVISYKIFKRSLHMICTQSITPKHDSFYSLTNHSYFNASPDQKVLQETLQIKADSFGLLDEQLLLKKYIPVDSVFDFRTPKLIGNDIRKTYPHHACGYDHPWRLNSGEQAVCLKGDKFIINISTDYDGVVCYSNNYAKVGDHILGRGYDKQYDAI